MIALKIINFWLILIFSLHLGNCLVASANPEPQMVYMIIAHPNVTMVNTSTPIRINLYENATNAKIDEKSIYADMSQKYKDGISIETIPISMVAGFDRATLKLIYEPMSIKVQPPGDYFLNIIRDRQEYGWLITPKNGPRQSLMTHLIFISANATSEKTEIAELKVNENTGEWLYRFIFGGLLLAILGLITAYLKKNKN